MHEGIKTDFLKAPELNQRFTDARKYERERKYDQWSYKYVLFNHRRG